MVGSGSKTVAGGHNAVAVGGTTEGQLLDNFGADAQTRTEDLLITNQLLYQLSYISEGAVL